MRYRLRIRARVRQCVDSLIRSALVWSRPIIDINRIKVGLREYARYRHDWNIYAALPGSEPLLRENAFPCLYDRVHSHPVDAHYFYQDVWAFKRILASSVERHVDVGSRAILVGMLTAITQTVFVDIRPLDVSLDNYESRSGSILALPFANDEVASLSCLHVAEHIGLGRYGDPLDPAGTQKACRELSRILAPGGTLYFSLPIGKQRVCFNAHRIHAPQQVLGYFGDLRLSAFSAVDDNGQFISGADPLDYCDARYACGLFEFCKGNAS